MSLKHKVDVLLATCNGEKYLEEQIQSLLNQTYSHIRILIRDDASNDSTPQILQKFVTAYPEKIFYFQGKQRLGVKANFSKLMELSSAPYILFCDQDDVWMKHKAETMLSSILQLEQEYGMHPYLIHSDLIVADEQLKTVHNSFWKYTCMHPQNTKDLNRLLSQNVVTGCAMMVNRLLIEIAKPIPNEAFMHDWWMALTAAAFGKIGVIDEPTIYYRQHNKNTLGAQKFGSIQNLKKNFQKLLNNDIRKFHQASVFYHRYHDLLDTSHRKDVKAFLNLQRDSWIQKRISIFKHGFYKQGLLRNSVDLLFGK